GSRAMHADSVAWLASWGCYRPDMVTLYLPEELPLPRAMRGEEALHELIFVRNPQLPAGLWIDARGTPLRDSAGTVCGGVVVFSDVSVPENLLRNKAAVEAFLTPVRNPSDPIEDRHELGSERFARFR